MRMLPSKLRTSLLITEVIACFALPAYLLFWGVVTAPMWLFAAMRGGTYAIWTLLYSVGGCLGIAAIVAFVRYVVSTRDEAQLGAIHNTAFALAGIIPLWGAVTDDFSTFDLNPFSFLVAIVPSACFLHFACLALRKSRMRGRERSLDRTPGSRVE
jgi:hypothetical protein